MGSISSWLVPGLLAGVCGVAMVGTGSAFAQSEALPVKMFNSSSHSYSMPAVLPKRKKISRREQAVRLNEQGVELAFQGQRDRGIAKIKQALAYDPQNTTILYNLAGLHLAAGEASPAIALMQRALAMEPEEISFLKRLGDAYVARNDLLNAVDTYERVAEINPSYGDALLKLGTLYGMQRKFDKAEATLRRAREVLDNDDRADSNLGNILIAAGKYGEAVTVLEKAFETNRSAENAVALGIAYESTGKYKKALRYFRLARDLGQKDDDLNGHIRELQELVVKNQ